MMLASSCSLQWPSSLDPAKVVVIGEQARENLAFPRGIVARRLLSALWPSLPCSRSPVAGWGIRRQPLTVMASSVVDDGGGLSADSVPKAHAPQVLLALMGSDRGISCLVLGLLKVRQFDCWPVNDCPLDDSSNAPPQHTRI